MKRLGILIFLVFLIQYTNSQIQYLRYNDNFDHLKSDSIHKPGFGKIKCIQPVNNITASFGGEAREQLQYYKNINFGDVPSTYEKSSTWQLWQRLMVHTNIESGKKTRIFAQLGSTYRFLNPNPLTPEIEQKELSLHQAFVDYRFNSKWLVRLGRQELSYGSHRLITFREGPNTRLTFDGGIVKYKNGKKSLDVFGLSPVISQKGVFDDQSFRDLIAGFYATERLPREISIDYYLIHFYSNRRKYNFVGGIENREVAGFRLFSESRKTNYEIEGTFQFGKFNQLRIHAFSLSADLSHKIFERKKLITGIAGNYITGDKNKNDNQVNTYNLLFSKPQFGLTAPIGATNMIAFNPYFKSSPIKKSNVYFAANFIWRQSNRDGTYSPGAIQLSPRPECTFLSSAKEIGTLVVLETSYEFKSDLLLAIDASKFFAGKYIKETGNGKDISYLSFKISFKF